MAHERYLTKSKFKLAMECPTKLFYSGQAEYANAKIEDSFLKSLAEGMGTALDDFETSVY